MTLLRLLVLLGCFGCAELTFTNAATTYDVGPGQPHPNLASVPWMGLQPGDTVNIHYKPDGYHEIILLSKSGTAAAPITIRGISDPITGERPVIDGQNAVTKPGTPWRSPILENLGPIVISRALGTSWGYRPSHITLENLHIRNANKQFTLTRANGQVVAFHAFAAGIYVEFATHLTIRGCEIEGSGNGLFINSKNGTGGSTKEISEAILVEHCHIHHNGNAGSYSEHNVYTEAAGITFQYNRIGPGAVGAHGEAIKDRSSGTIIRYNTVLNGITGSGHGIWILQTQGGKGVIDQQPNYHTTHIYGNVIYNGPGGGSGMVRYSAGAEDIAAARRGPHYFYHNTLVSQANQMGPKSRWWTVALMTPVQSEMTGLGWTTTVDCRNNIFANLPETPGAPASDFSLLGSNAGELHLGKNWITSGFHPYRVPFGTVTFYGTITGDDQLVAGANPGFMNLGALDFHLANGSPCLDRAGALAAGLPAALAVTEEIVEPQSSELRNVLGSAGDLGAFEGPGVAAPQTPGTIQFSAANFAVSEGAGPATVTVTRSGGAWGEVTVKYGATTGSASPLSDFVKTYGTLVWGDGQQGPKTFNVTILNDAVAEADEAVMLVLGQPTGNATIGNSNTATLTIQDDDAGAPNAWTAYDASATGGLVTQGYVGAIFDGRYLYFAPYQEGNPILPHGRVLRYDTQAQFKTSASWQVYDAGNTGGFATKGYHGGVFDGRYVYFSPAYGGASAGKVLQFDTQGAFSAAASWNAYDASHVDGLDTSGFQGAVFDGRYIYFVPHVGAAFHGNVLRFETLGNFASASSWRGYNAGATSGLVTKGYSGGVFDGRYIYFVPTYDGSATHGRVLRYDTQSEFASGPSWVAYDAGNSGGLANTKGFKGGVFDGRFVYFVPYSGSTRVMRYDTQNAFANGASWSAFDVAALPGGVGGYMGGAFDGRYVWFTPYNNNGAHGKALRLDTQGVFSNSANWKVYDAGNTDGLEAKGFQGAAFDGRHVYFVPYRKGAPFTGVVLRVEGCFPPQLPATIWGGSFF